MSFFFINKPIWKHVFIMQFLYLTDRLNKVRTNQRMLLSHNDIEFKT